MASDVPMQDAASSSAAAAAGGSAPAVDESLYSRQLYVFGHEAQQKLQQSNVLFVGLRGLGVETAKNVVLAGVKSVSLLDQSLVSIADLGAQFYLTEEHVGKVTRAAASLAQLQTLNPYVAVSEVREPLSEALLASGRFQIVVLTDSSLSEAQKWDAFCHPRGIKFLWAECPGVYAHIFVDFPGPPAGSADSEAQLGAKGHYVSDTTGEQPQRGLISHVSCGNPGIVTVHEDQRHGLQDGDYVTFEEVEGMIELNSGHSEPRPVKVLTPFTFTIEDTTLYRPYSGTKGYFQQVRKGKFFEFKPMAEVLTKDTPISNDNWQNEKALHLLTLALGRWRQEHQGRQPRVDSWDDAREVVELAKKINGAELQPAVDGVNEWLLLQLARVASCELNPLCALMGGILGQEVLKGASGKFTPIQQFYYYDGSHVLPSEAEQTEHPLDLAEHRPQNSRYDAQIGVFGAKIQRKLQEQSYFVVGAGAIGCEMVKNFALMGLGTGVSSTGKKGCVYITDMDTIERSNLNRQFLFRSDDVGQMKSTTAAKAVQRMNPALNIQARSIRVAPATEDVYDDDFWNGLDGAVTALDNVEARLYVDQRCVYYQKPMVDSGTLGTKGSTQVVVPFLTESYGSSRDPPEESIAICTLKSFPHKIEHTIQWARDHFEALFAVGPSEVNNYLTQPSYLDELAKQQNQQLQNLQTIKSYLVDDKPASWADCVRWARLLFEDEYHYKIAQLLHNFPVDSTTAEGVPFWSGTKRPPVVLRFDENDPTHMAFIVSAATLRAVNYRVPVEKDLAATRAALATVKPGPFVPAQNAKIAATEAEAKEMMSRVDDDHEYRVNQIVAALPKPDSLPQGYHLQSIEFEKDDDSNAHMDFITACSNLRARNYAIRESSKHETKLTAGKIIPAVATTTALVTGAVCMELYKLVQTSKKRVEDFRCFSCNLALPILSQAEPLAPAYSTTQLKDGKEWRWSLWDRVDVNEGDITLEQLMEHFKKVLGLEITMLSAGAAMLYCDFGTSKKKMAERRATRVSALVEQVSGQPLPPKSKYIVLEACVQREEDEEEVEIPYVRMQFRP